MRHLLVLLAVGALLGAFGGSVAMAQDNDATPDDVEAAFGSLSLADVEAMGYVLENECISAELAGAPAELGAMGYHAVNESMVDDEVDPLAPEAVLFDADNNLIAIEYVAEPNSGLSVFGQDLVFVPPIGHDALHVWFLDNPNGQFADFNPNVSCQAVAAPPTTGTGGYLGGDGSSGAWLFALLAGLAGIAMLTGGFALRTRLR